MPLQHRPVNGLTDPNQIRRDRETVNNILTHQFDDSRVRTPAEVAAGVAPVNYAYPPYDINRYGAHPSASATLNTAAIQQAINASVIEGGRVTASILGTYTITAATTITLESGTEYTAFVMASSMFIDMPGVILKMADSISTDAASKAYNMFATNQVLQNVKFSHVIMDMNGANNPISPSRGSGTYAAANIAHIVASGTPGGIAARMDDVLIEDCWFINTPGVNCIVMAQSNSASVALGTRWTVRNCLFYNNGLDSIDHTSIFAWADDVVCDGNNFITPDALQTTKLGGITTYEVHGSNHRYVNNRVYGYYRAMFVAGNNTTPVLNTLIANNVFFTRYFGIVFFRETPGDLGNARTKICNNWFIFDSLDLGPTAPDQKSAILIGTVYAVTDIDIRTNCLYSTDTAVGTVFITITTSSTASQVFDNIVFANNTQRGGTFGTYITTTATNGIAYLELTDNTFHSLSDSAGFSTPIGIRITANQPVQVLKLEGNTCIDMRGGSAECDYGMLLQGTITNYLRGRNYSFGMVTSDYDDSSLTVTNRRGLYSTSTVASAATIAIPHDVDDVTITGTTNITSITAAGHAGHTVTLYFQGALTFTDGSNLVIAGNFVTSLDDTITLFCNGSSWYEKSRSVN